MNKNVVAPNPAPPPSAGKLDKYVLAYATAQGLAVGRVRHWISFMMLSGALDRASTRSGGPAVHPLGDAGVRVWVQIAYRSQHWATVQVDLSHPEAQHIETERLGGIPLARFGLSGPPDIVCLSLRYHIAQKFHGMTKVLPDGEENNRYRDAIDLLLLRDLVGDDDLASVRNACEETFRTRAQHAWPPAIVLPLSWRAPFTAQVQTIGLAVDDLSEAERALQNFVNQIVVASHIA